ncbi:PREDICTED: retinitis pigmentosa 9 protein homolog [Gekko japonicus]|uniref:Retinitis pigmentosa 9 protein homolog n=1 Tax=Gekko japonicus TaxID=146911 RepID=A0ABM1JIC6_GEKJA|nr:PREDICTED: retinitis pigmentosa 9 protein homolog [Gekko japonicus]
MPFMRKAFASNNPWHVARVEQTRGGEERRRQPEAAPEPQRVSGRRGEETGGSSTLKRHRSHSESLPGDNSGGGREQKRKTREVEPIQHLESFYEKLPPELIKENETKPEDCIPDVPGNENTQEFLAHAPTKGLWMPLGKEVKVMECWRCKSYEHRRGDKECAFFIKDNQKLEQFRVVPEDSVNDTKENKRHEKEMRMQQLKKLLEDSIRTQTEEEVVAEGEEEEGALVFAEVRKDIRRKRGRRGRKKRESSNLPNETELD